MQTFLPSGSPTFAAQALDNKRLNKQILEGYQILKVLATNGKAWRNHPAVLMWEGHEGSLLEYVGDMITEAKYRGIKTENNQANINALFAQYGKQWNSTKPNWMTDKTKLAKIVATHRANLYRKDPIFYAEYSNAVESKYNQTCCPKCLYFWPTHPLKKK